MNPLPDKPNLRRLLLQHRRSLSLDVWRTKSDQLIQQLQSLPLFLESQTILAYFSFKQEPDLTPLFTDTSRRWGFSRCVGDSLVWHYWRPSQPLTLGTYGILEPHADLPLVDAQDVDLILVPTVACDHSGYRLGYGGGFFDRLLSDPLWSQKPAIAIVFEDAFLPQLPNDSWDQKLHGVCTDQRSAIF